MWGSPGGGGFPSGDSARRKRFGIRPGVAVPDRAVLVIGVIAALVAATGTLRGVASAASFTILVYYGIANLAALRMPREAKLYPDTIPVVGLASCTVLAVSLSPSVILAGLTLLAAGFAFRRTLHLTVRG